MLSLEAGGRLFHMQRVLTRRLPIATSDLLAVLAVIFSNHLGFALTGRLFILISFAGLGPKRRVTDIPALQEMFGLMRKVGHNPTCGEVLFSRSIILVEVEFAVHLGASISPSASFRLFVPSQFIHPVPSSTSTLRDLLSQFAHHGGSLAQSP